MWEEGRESLSRTGEEKTYAQVGDGWDYGGDAGALGRCGAFAADQLIYCKAAPCFGTDNDDKIYERQRNGAYDRIILKGGHDLLLANGYTNDTDIVKGGSGYDKIKVNDGDSLDRASGGAGGDWCIVDAKREAGTGCSRVTIRWMFTRQPLEKSQAGVGGRSQLCW